MALTDFTTAKVFLSVLPAALVTSDAWIIENAPAACDAVRRYCKRELETATYTEYLSGNGQPKLPLRQWPVLALTSVYMDPAGFFGKGANSPFPAGSLLVEGRDYVGEYAVDGTIKSGNLIRLGGGITGTTLTNVWPWDWTKGSLTVRLPPIWPPGYGNIKVTYSAGYGTGPQYTGGTLPNDLTLAANLVLLYIRKNAPLEGMSASENLGAYSYSLSMHLAFKQNPELGEARQLLQYYRELPL